MMSYRGKPTRLASLFFYIGVSAILLKVYAFKFKEAYDKLE
jgi:hypothetical protein